jgi:hypothetical protein
MGDLLAGGFRGGGDRRAFTEDDLTALVELLTQSAVEVEIQGDEIVLLPIMWEADSHPVMKIRLANVIAATVDHIKQDAVDDAHRAYCELYGLAGLLREGAELAEATARAVAPNRWRDIETPYFIRSED